MDDVVSAIAGHSVRTRPAPTDVPPAEPQDDASRGGELAGAQTPPPGPVDVAAELPQTETAAPDPREGSPVENAPDPAGGPGPRPAVGSFAARPPPGPKRDVSPAPSEVAPAAVAPSRVVPSRVVPSRVVPSEVVPSEVVPSEVAPSEVAPSGVAPSEVAPSEVVPSEVVPSGVAPSAVAPAAVALSGVAPSAVAPSAVAPAAVAPSAVAPSEVVPSAVASVEVAPSAVAPAAASPSPAELVLLVRDPDWLFGYWDASIGSGDGLMELVDDEGTSTAQTVNVTAGYAFLQAPVAGRTYRASLVSARGVLAVSGPVHVPQPVVSVPARVPKAVSVGPKLRAVPPASEASTLPSVLAGPMGMAASGTAQKVPSSWAVGLMPTSPIALEGVELAEMAPSSSAVGLMPTSPGGSSF